MTPDESRFVRPYVPADSPEPVSTPPAPSPVAPPKPPTFRRPRPVQDQELPGVPPEPIEHHKGRVVGAIVALALAAVGLTVRIAWPTDHHSAATTPVDKLTNLYLPTAGDTAVTGTQAVTSQGAAPTRSESHHPSTSARPPTAAAGQPPVTVPTSPAGPSPTANPLHVNLALGKPTTASSTEAAAWDAKNAVDGDTGTRWGSQFNDPQWIRVDLGGLWSVSDVRLDWETAYAVRYNIETSTDGTTWTVAASVDNGDGGTDDVSFAPLAARYVMMLGVKRSSGYGYSLWELEIR